MTYNVQVHAIELEWAIKQIIAMQFRNQVQPNEWCLAQSTTINNKP